MKPSYVLHMLNMWLPPRQPRIVLDFTGQSALQVDIDLTLEGAGTKLSRYSCFIDLDMRYGFILHNIARQTVLVNNVPVETGKKAKLPHLSLIEISGVELLFQVNAHALTRLCMRPPPCPA